MCLFLSTPPLELIANKNIVCYKFVDQKKIDLHTLYQRQKVAIGNTYTSKLVMRKSPIADSSGYVVEQGLHSFASLRKLLKFLNPKEVNVYRANSNMPILCVAECIIPKGSRYYKGLFANCVSYASDKLHYVRIVEEY